MKNYKQNEMVVDKGEALEIAEEMSRTLGQLEELYRELERLGYEDYRIEQDIVSGYMGDTLYNLIDELPEKLEKVIDENEVDGYDHEEFKEYGSVEEMREHEEDQK